MTWPGRAGAGDPPQPSTASALRRLHGCGYAFCAVDPPSLFLAKLDAASYFRVKLDAGSYFHVNFDAARYFM